MVLRQATGHSSFNFFDFLNFFNSNKSFFNFPYPHSSALPEIMNHHP